LFLCPAVLLLCGTAVTSEAFKLPDTGQDGAYNINPMSYTDNGNGTVTDNNTGLCGSRKIMGIFTFPYDFLKV